MWARSHGNVAQKLSPTPCRHFNYAEAIALDAEGVRYNAGGVR
jgi:hypothetical protein